MSSWGGVISYNNNDFESILDFYNVVAPIYNKGPKLMYKAKYLGFGQTQLTIAMKKIALDRLKRHELDLVEFEVNMMKSLEHENLMPLLFNFVEEDCLWLILPHCEYGTAAQLAKPVGLPESCITLMMKDVLSALEYLHGNGIVHRSVKGSHILVYGDGRCLLTGFSYCASMVIDGRLQQSIHEYPPNPKNILNWLAPELLEQNLLGYSTKSDIYSLGVTCCELANGCTPFEHLKPTEMLLDKITGNYPKPLDSTCDELNALNLEELDIEDKSRYEYYKERRFTDLFHSFTVDHCLLTDQHARPTATQLLTHKFIKEARKLSKGSSAFESNLLGLLPTDSNESSVVNSQGSTATENSTSYSPDSIISWDF